MASCRRGEPLCKGEVELRRTRSWVSASTVVRDDLADAELEDLVGWFEEIPTAPKQAFSLYKEPLQQAKLETLSQWRADNLHSPCWEAM